MPLAVDVGLVVLTIVQTVYWYWRITEKPVPLHTLFAKAPNAWAIGLFLLYSFLLTETSRFDNLVVTFLVLVAPPLLLTYVACRAYRPKPKSVDAESR